MVIKMAIENVRKYMQQFGIADFHMKELGTSQHGHLLGSKYMDTLQGKGTSR